ncbi:MAG: hypothetical protein HKN45_02310 [Flavobacteriales bacterium]|nr:hypothetical protein [Flavobacteriales bacterium]NNK80044.1 hypothetical protein [Flavobacteriales bacterium]
MIKFFRKIRQRLLSESKFSKYLLYAIGEVILVIIGILMALQINNWNEERKLDASNEVLKHKLMGELDLNVDRLIRLDSLASRNGKPRGLKAIILNADTAIDRVESGLERDDIEWLLNTDLLVASSFNLHSSVYEEMKNTGRLYTLGSDSLLQSIDKYYRRIEREEFYATVRNEQAIKYWDECKYGFKVLTIDFAELGITAIEIHPWLFRPDSKELLDLRLALHTGRSCMRRNRARLKEMIADSRALRSKIESSLGTGIL